MVIQHIGITLFHLILELLIRFNQGFQFLLTILIKEKLYIF